MTAFALTLILVLLLASTRTQAFQDLNDSLLESIANGDFLRVRHLLAQGADPNCFDKRGFSALLFATEKGDTQIVTSLVDAGAEIEAVEKEGNTALHFAADKVGIMKAAIHHQ
jgi:ankyrin repeat protein